MIERRGQLLACDFVLATDCPDLAQRLGELTFPVTAEFLADRRHVIEIRRDRGYRLRENGLERGGVASAEEAAAWARERVERLALEALDRFAKVHAGCATWQGRTFLVSGAARSGKTTLMARLLYDGVDVQGDDTVLVRDGRALAFPRPFGLRRGTLSLVPELSARIPPWALDGPPNGFHVLALDPAQLGFPWRLTARPVDAVFFLDPVHGEPSRLVGCPRYEMVRRLMTESTAPAGGARSWIREIAGVVARAECFVLKNGELDSASRLIGGALPGVPARGVGVAA